jgi:signal transduction histidine kinase/CheY-like chemotaxis protein
MRVKAILGIMTIVCVVTMASLLSNVSFTRERIFTTMEQILSLASDIADDLVTTKIRLLKADAATVAERLLQTGSHAEMQKVMKAQLGAFPEFTSLTVYDRNGIILNSGNAVSCDDPRESRYLQIALDGGTIISTTHYNRISGAFVMHVIVPMGQNKALSATFSGMLFADLLAAYKFWQTGNVLMLDETGAVIAHYRSELVRERRNLIEEAKTNPELAATGRFLQSMLSTESGAGVYTFEGHERLCSFKRVSGSKSGWRIVVAAPLDESPAAHIREGLLLSALLFLAVGFLVSLVVSDFVVRPFNKIEEQNKSLAELNATVQAASEAKSKFLANMSHEMRTPLNAIIGLSQLSLASGKLHEENHANLEKICSAGTTLLTTVNDILDISKIEAGKFELIPLEYDIPSLLNDAVTQSVMHIGENSIQFVLDIDENLPTRLYGDELRIKQIFTNLLSNAFKYTQAGTVEFSLSCRREGDTVWMIASVRDTGIGIRPEDVRRLFFEYAQVNMEANRTITGTGLGLPITKRLAEMLGGSISVESEYGKGSVFTVRLLQQFVTDAVIGPTVANSLQGFRYSDQKLHQGAKMKRIKLPYARVLVVDDVLTNLDVAKGMLKPYGMQVDCVTSGQQAVDAIRENVRYNAVFMDHMMPGMDGLEAARIIREEIDSEYARTVPIIALTANAIIGNEEMFLREGFQAFIPKPIEIARLDAVIRQWVRDKKLEDSTFEDDGVEQPAEVTPRIFSWQVEGVDLQRGLERFGNDEDAFLQVLRSYAVNTRPLLETIRGVTRENLADYAIATHGVKGSSRGICAEKVGDWAETLEKAAKAGDFDFVAVNNAAFLEAAEKLVGDLDALLRSMTDPKPKLDQPDRDALNRLMAACEAYAMDGVDAAMAELESYEYESDNGLVAWLREHVDRMNVTQIKERLSALPR